MATHDYDLANQSGASFRSDLNNALQAVLTNNSSASAPSTTAAYMFWADTNTGTLKIRNSSNNAWIELLQLDGTLTLEDGSASAVALGFRDELNTGIFSSGANNFDVSIAGTTRLNISATGLNITGTVTDDGATHDGDVTFTGAAANVVFDKSDNALEFADNAKAVFGADADLQIYHDGSNSRLVDSGTGNLIFSASQLQINNAGNTEVQAKFIENGAVELYHDNVKKAETTSTGINVTGTVVDDGATHDGDVTFTGASANVVFDKSDNALEFADNAKAVFGTGGDLEISHNGSNSIINDAGTGELQLQRGGNTILTLDADGITITDPDGRGEVDIKGFEGTGARLRLTADEGDDNGDQWMLESSASDNKFNILNNVSGSQVDKWILTTDGDVTMKGHLDLPDSKQIRLGDSDDLTIEHDGSNSIINDAGTGNLQIKLGGTLLANFSVNGLSLTATSGKGEVDIIAFEDSNANLNLKADEGDDNGDIWRLQSTAATNNFSIMNNISGSQVAKWVITTDGDVQQVGHLDLPDDKQLRIGTGDDFTIEHDSSDNTTKVTMGDQKNVKFQNTTTNGNNVIIGSHAVGADDNRQLLATRFAGVPQFHTDVNGNMFAHASISAGRTRSDAASPVNNYQNGPFAVNAFSGRTDDSTAHRAQMKMVACDYLDGQGDSSILYFTDSGSDTASVDHDQDQKFSVKQNGMIEGMSSLYTGRVKSDERSNTNVVYASASGILLQASYNQNIFTRMRGRNTDNTDDVFTADTGGGVVIKFQSDGNGRFDGGADIGNASDYAEYFEWADGNTGSADRRGITVVMDGEKIKPATDSDDASKIIGVVSANPAVVGDSAWSEWQAAHKKDAYGSWTYEDKEYLIWNDFTTVSTVDDATQETAQQPDINDPNVTSEFQILVSDIEKEKAAGRCPQEAIDQNLRITRPSRVYNESYDATKTYEPRSARKEWDAIGLMGKLVVRRGQPVGTNWILMKSNVGTDPNDASIILDKYLVR